MLNLRRPCCFKTLLTLFSLSPVIAAAHPGHDHTVWTSEWMHVMPFIAFFIFGITMLLKLNQKRLQAKKTVTL